MSDDRVCTCIATTHPHEKGKCDEPPTIKGGICTSCRYYATHPPERKPA